MGKTHLNWLEDNRPKFLESLFRQNLLKEFLNKAVNLAEETVEELQQAGRTPEEALEVVTQYLLAPPTEEEREPLSPTLRNEIEESLQMN